MLELSNPEPRTSKAVAAWCAGTVYRLGAGARPDPGPPKKPLRWVPSPAGRGWRLCLRVGGGAKPVYFHGGNARPLTMNQADAVALSAALNRRPETWQSLAPGHRY